MKKISIIMIIGIFLCFYGYAQLPTLEWAHRYPDTNTFIAGAAALVLDNADNVYVTGYGDSGYCTVKYSPDGTRLWTAKFPGPINIAYSKAIAVDSFSNVYVTGYVNSGGANFDYCTIKYDSNGLQQWARFYNGPSNSYDEAHKIAIDKKQNIYVAGFSSLFGGFTFQFAIIKYSPDGVVLWVQRYGNPDSGALLNGITIDDSCRVYITGTLNDRKATTVKFDSSGNLLWAQFYAVASQSNDIALDRDNNVLITGWTDEGPGNGDCLTIKYSTSGVQQWSRRYNPDSLANGSAYYSNAVKVDRSGNIYIGGSFRAEQGAAEKLCIVKYSASGDFIWSYRGIDSLFSQQISIDFDRSGNIYTAYSNVFYTQYPNQSSYSVMKYDSSGSVYWNKIYKVNGGGTYVQAFTIDSENNIYLTGISNTRMLTVKYAQVLGIKPISVLEPNESKLYQNYPNPFNPVTNIRFEIPKPVGFYNMLDIGVSTKLIIYDILGREISILVNENLKPGGYEIEWDATSFSSGIYIYKLITNEFNEAKKMILLK